MPTEKAKATEKIDLKEGYTRRLRTQLKELGHSEAAIELTVTAFDAAWLGAQPVLAPRPDSRFYQSHPDVRYMALPNNLSMVEREVVDRFDHAKDLHALRELKASVLRAKTYRTVWDHLEEA